MRPAQAECSLLVGFFLVTWHCAKTACTWRLQIGSVSGAFIGGVCGKQARQKDGATRQQARGRQPVSRHQVRHQATGSALLVNMHLCMHHGAAGARHAAELTSANVSRCRMGRHHDALSWCRGRSPGASRVSDSAALERRHLPPLPPARLAGKQKPIAAMDLSGYQALVWSLAGVLLASFAGFAIIYTYLRHRKQQSLIQFNQEEFVTARRQVCLASPFSAVVKKDSASLATVAMADEWPWQSWALHAILAHPLAAIACPLLCCSHASAFLPDLHFIPSLLFFPPSYTLGGRCAHCVVVLCGRLGCLGDRLTARVHRQRVWVWRGSPRPRLLLPLFGPASHHDCVCWRGHPGKCRVRGGRQQHGPARVLVTVRFGATGGSRSLCCCCWSGASHVCAAACTCFLTLPSGLSLGHSCPCHRLTTGTNDDAVCTCVVCCLLQRKVPHVLSLTDFMGWRYGTVAKHFVVLLCLFNMSVGE